MIKQKHDQRWGQNAVIAFIIVIKEVVHAVASRDFRIGGGKEELTDHPPSNEFVSFEKMSKCVI